MPDELLKKLRVQAKADLDFYSNRHKEQREQWVASSFLTALQIEHNEKDLISLEQRSHIDVKFNHLNFQIKEIMDPNFKRNDHYKKIYNSLQSIDNSSEANLAGSISDIPEISKMVDLVINQCSELNLKYKEKCSEIDLLFYITRPRSGLLSEEDLRIDFSIFNFRSISCLNSKQVAVLFAAEDAPLVIKNKLGILRIRN